MSNLIKRLPPSAPTDSIAGPPETLSTRSRIESTSLGAAARDSQGVGGLMNNRWVTLIYLIFVFLPLAFMPDVDRTQILASLLATALYLPLHLTSWQIRRPQAYWRIAATTAIGLVLIPLNPGGNTFIIYAMAMAAVLLPFRTALLAGLLSWLAMGATLWIATGNLSLTATYAGITAIIGGMVQLGTAASETQARHVAELEQSQSEIRRLAAVAERERIARDLHDLLGHTLSVVVLKSELAGKLIDRDPGAAAQQMREVEQVARQALGEVREAVSGFREGGLAPEINACRVALLSADIELAADIESLQLAPPVESALSLGLREAVTNILRHAKASRVEVTMQSSGETLHLKISDDGVGGIVVEGNGLRGMRERLQSIDATLEVCSPKAGGSQLLIAVPSAWRPGEQELKPA